MNAIVYASKQADDPSLAIYLEDAWLDYELKKSKKRKLAEGIRIVITIAPLPTGLKSYKPFAPQRNAVREAQNQYLLENKRIMKAHYGFMDIEQVDGHLIQTYVIPAHLKTLRPKINEFANEDIAQSTHVDSPEDQAFLQAAVKHGFNKKHLTKALQVAKHYHGAQKRRSGEPFYLHPVAVATLLLKHTKEEDVVIAGLLHDTIEDTAFTMFQVRAMFGDKVGQIVGQVTHLYGTEQRPKLKLEKAATLDKLIENGDQDALLVKLMDRYHNMQTIQHKSKEARVRIATETKKVFIPIAKRLGLPSVAKELKDMVDGC